jgi:hypothetical protein
VAVAASTPIAEKRTDFFIDDSLTDRYVQILGSAPPGTVAVG